MNIRKVPVQCPLQPTRKIHIDIAGHTEITFKKSGRYKLTKHINESQEIKCRNTEKSDNTETMQIAREVVKGTRVEIP